MEQIVVKRVNGTTFNLQSRGEFRRITRATQSADLLGKDVVDVSVTSRSVLTFDIGDKITIIGRDYTLNQPARESKDGEDNYKYDLQFEGVQYDLMRAGYNVNVNTTDGAIQDLNGDSLTGTIKIFLDVLIANIERVFPGKWTLGTYPENTATKTLTFSESDNCLSVLQTLCGEDNYNTEFKIAIDEYGNRTLNVGPVGEHLLSVEYGRGKGLYNLTREKQSSSNIITRLFVYGSSKNINTSKYRASKLCLPDCSKSQSYIQDNAAITKYGVWENTKTFEDIYPKIPGKPNGPGFVTGLGANVYEFIDSHMDFDLNEKDVNGNSLYILPGAVAKVHFNTGNLAGYEFEANYNHTTKKFTLIKQKDENGYSFPSEKSAAFQFAVNDEFVLLEIRLPETYEAAAETRLYDAGLEYYNKYKQPLVQYGLAIDKFHLAKMVSYSDYDWNIISTGDYIHVTDASWDVDKELRVKGFTRDLMDEYPSYTQITISDLPVSITNLTRIITELKGLGNVVKINNLNDPARARRNWKVTSEVVTMLETLQAEAALIGNDPAAQYTLSEALFSANYQGNPNNMHITACSLAHSYYPEGAPGTWNVSAADFADLDATPYYLYVKASKSANTAIFYLSSSKLATEVLPGYYYFPVGILSSVIDGRRVFQTAKGYTLITGDDIKTGRVSSHDGNTYFDLDSGEFFGTFKFSSGTSVQTAVETAQTTANTANGSIADIANDNKLTPSKKQALYSQMQTLQSERLAVLTDADYYEVYPGEYLSECDNIDTYVYPLIEVLTTTTTINANEFRSNFSIYFDALNALKSAISAKAKDLADEAKSYAKFMSENLQSQIDGQIESHFKEYDPTTANLPASDWNTDELKQQHANDTFTNTLTGGCWRWQQVATVWGWGVISDTATQLALAAAAKAQDTADGKRRVFATTPTASSVYDVGDLWVNATYPSVYTNELLKCKTAKAAGIAFNIAHWEKAAGYTDDTTANQAYGLASDAWDDAANAEAHAQEAKAAADAIATTIEAGKVMYEDATFKAGFNGITIYNIAANGNSVHTRVAKPSDAPTGSTHMLRVSNIGIASPGLGGLTFSTYSRANAVFVTKIIAKMPIGYSVEFETNAVGDGNKLEWLTPRAGTGKYETYVFRVTCGSTGTFSSTNYFYFIGTPGTPSVPVNFDIAFATVYDLTDFVLYDNTKTVIDGGIVTGGTIQVAGDPGAVLAGITGEGTSADSVRFWAGATKANRATAPFRAQQDGKVFMSGANVSGEITATKMAITGAFITPLATVILAPVTMNYIDLTQKAYILCFYNQQTGGYLPSAALYDGYHCRIAIRRDAVGTLTLYDNNQTTRLALLSPGMSIEVVAVNGSWICTISSEKYIWNVYPITGGGLWYRVYSDGWVEQGGNTAVSGGQTITFPISFRATNYSVVFNTIRQTSGASGYNYVWNKTTETFYAVADEGSGISWRAAGFSDSYTP